MYLINDSYSNYIHVYKYTSTRVSRNIIFDTIIIFVPYRLADIVYFIHAYTII